MNIVYMPNKYYALATDAGTAERRMIMPKTNADRIRAMSDEELANVFTDYSNNSRWVTEIGREICFERIYEWLQQTAE